MHRQTCLELAKVSPQGPQETEREKHQEGIKSTTTGRAYDEPNSVRSVHTADKHHHGLIQEM